LDNSLIHYCFYPERYNPLTGNVYLMETAQPNSLRITLTEAFDFLKESAWVLEDAGFKIIVPAWYTPVGRRRAKICLKASRCKRTSNSRSKLEILMK
jgi:hypothetical protein